MLAIVKVQSTNMLASSNAFLLIVLVPFMAPSFLPGWTMAENSFGETATQR
jgi:hypothetical protein